MSDNLAIFVGNVGQDGQVKEVGKDNTLVLNFSVAVKTGYGQRAETLWVQCAIWGDRAEKLEQYITKGTKLVVKGEVTPEAYENKDGDLVAQLRMNVSDFSFAGGKEDGGGGDRSSSGGGRGRSRGPNRNSGRNNDDDNSENEGMGSRNNRDEDIPFD
tara:strand:- start:222 stop:695 length:474 start_codon:yes stop_codon:yes gene_type:complete